MKQEIIKVFLTIIIACALIFSACGKKGPPLPKRNVMTSATFYLAELSG
jgi:predicted small lipoprotein YifL